MRKRKLIKKLEEMPIIKFFVCEPEVFYVLDVWERALHTVIQTYPHPPKKLIDFNTLEVLEDVVGKEAEKIVIMDCEHILKSEVNKEVKE